MGVVVSQSGSLPMSSFQHPTMKEWRTVAERSFHNSGGEEPKRVKFGQFDKRTIYEVHKVTGQLDSDFCSITIDAGGLNDETFQGRLQGISRQREELELLETDLRAQAIAMNKILELGKNLQVTQIRDHVDSTTKLKGF